MQVGEYLFSKIKALGVEHIFGIPGDFALPLFSAMEKAGLQIVVTTHEPSAGFAADAYARLRGFGVATVTFGAGGLNMVNSIAQAYAEKSPVLVISGAPEMQGRKLDVLFHHRVKTFESQLNVYKAVTGSAVALTDAASAGEEIDRVLAEVLRTKRPGYIEVPRDVARARVKKGARSEPAPLVRDQAALQEAMQEVVSRLNASHQPVIYAGVEIERFDLREKLIALVEKLNLPIATSVEGKAVFPEDHPNFIGIYMGRVGSEVARQMVESSDCLLILGAFLTDVNTGLFTAKVDRSTVISASAEELSISYHRYPEVTLPDLIDHLLQTKEVRRWELARPELPSPSPPPSSGQLRTIDIVEELNAFLVPGRYIVVSDVGDCLYAGLDLKTDHFLGPGYYNSMGFGVPAAVAAQLAVPERRVIALVGDGGFQMTGMEMATAQKLGLNPIIIVWNNAHYATLRAIAGKKRYFRLYPWDYAAIARTLGGKGMRVEKREEFRKALRRAEKQNVCTLIEAVIDPDDISPTWQRIAQEISTHMRETGPGR